jgi:hypothetical protein
MAGTSLISRDQQKARQKGWIAAAATAGSVLLMTASLPLGIIAVIPAGLLVKDWFTFRAKRGMRF